MVFTMNFFICTQMSENKVLVKRRNICYEKRVIGTSDKDGLVKKIIY